MPPRNNKIVVPIERKKELQESLKNAYIAKNVLNNKLVRAISEEGASIKRNIYNEKEIPKYPCLINKKNNYNQKRNEMNKYIQEVVPYIKRILNLRTSAVASALRKTKTSNNENEEIKKIRFVNNSNGKLAKYNGLTPTLAKEVLNGKNNILQNIEEQNYLSNQFIRLNERLMGASYNENENPFCNGELNNSSTTNSIKYTNLERPIVKESPRYRAHTTSSSTRSNYGQLQAKRAAGYYGGKKVKSKKVKSKKSKKVKSKK